MGAKLRPKGLLDDVATKDLSRNLPVQVVDPRGDVAVAGRGDYAICILLAWPRS